MATLEEIETSGNTFVDGLTAFVCFKTQDKELNVK